MSAVLQARQSSSQYKRNGPERPFHSNTCLNTIACPWALRSIPADPLYFASKAEQAPAVFPLFLGGGGILVGVYAWDLGMQNKASQELYHGP